MSSVKCVGLMAGAGALAMGGLSLYKGVKTRNKIVADAQKFSDAHGGKIPTGGMTKDGKMWDGFTTVEQIKKDSAKGLAIGTTLSAIAGGITTAVISGLTLLAKAHIK
jgi:hypothetical protein